MDSSSWIGGCADGRWSVAIVPGRTFARGARAALRLLAVVAVAVAGALALPASAQTAGPPRLLSVSGAGTVDQGERVMLAVIFFSNPPTFPMTYQWTRNGVAIPGATASSHVIASATSGDAGTYAITVTSDGGSSSVSGELTVRPPALIQFSTVFVDPAPGVSAGSGMTFRVSAIGSFPRTYQWRKDGVDIAGATNLQLNLGPVSVADSGSYTLIGRNSLGSSSTTPVTVTVSPATLIVFAPGSPADASFTEGLGGQLTFTLSQGSHPMSYQWRKDGVAIPNALEAYLNLGPIMPATAGRYSVTATNPAGSVTSREAIVTVVRATPIVVSTHPAPQTVAVGQEARFSVALSAGTQPISYQWRKDGVALPGQTSTVFAVTAATTADAGDYSVVLTNPAGSVTSNAARLTVTSATAPVIVRPPTDVTVNYFEQFGLSAEITGTAPLTYQWRRNGQLVGNSGPSLSYHSVTQDTHGGTYVLEVSNAAGTVSTAPVTVTVRAPVLPVLLAQPQPATALVGGEVSFSLRYSDVGAGYVTVQWLKNGQPVGTTATGNPGSTGGRTENFYIRAAQPSDAGDYSARLTSTAGVVMTTTARLTLQSGPGSGQDYSGIYFGSLREFSATVGEIAVYIRPDRTGVVLSQVNQMPGLSSTFALSAAGTFRFETNRYPVLGFTYLLSGSVGSDGSISGNIEGQGTTFTARKIVGTSPLAGLYSARAPEFGGGELHAIVGGHGRVLAVVHSGQIVVALAEQLEGSARLSVTNPNGHTLQLTAVPAVGELNATATAPRGGTASFLAVCEGLRRAARLANISTRGRAGVGDDAMIAGFVVAGSGPRTVLLRAIGPALADFGVPGALADARLTLFRGQSAMMVSDDWGAEPDAARIVTAANRVGAFALPTSGRDAVLLATLEPGNYTAQVTAKNGSPGVSLVEVYDAGDGVDATAPRLLNIATRGWVGGDDEALIAGIVVTGNAPKTVLVRAVGPGLASLGVGRTLADPKLALQQGQTIVAANDDWNRLEGGSDVVALVAATTKVGAFALANASADAALLARLYPGNYTARVSGKAGATGVALIEVYEVDE